MDIILKKKFNSNKITIFWIYSLFFLSGFPALIYQIVWQRSLYSFYGVSIQSITIIVADFMLGLGIGAYAGALISKNKKVNLIFVYALLEFASGIIGHISLHCLQWIGSHTIDWSTPQISIMLFFLLLVPTIIMGANLPILTEYLVKRLPHVGRSTAILYSANTMGAAICCFFLSSAFMPYLGQSSTIGIAVILNFFIGLGCFFLYGHSEKKITPAIPQNINKTLKLRNSIVLALLIGTISLSYEILWLHLISFSHHSSARSITNALGYYLAGIGLGSIICDKAFRNNNIKSSSIFRLIYFSAITSALILPLIKILVFYHFYLLSTASIMCGTLFYGALLPAIAHFTKLENNQPGYTIGTIYFGNIIGATLGSLCTGFFLLDILNLTSISVLLFCFSLFLCYLSIKVTSTKTITITMPMILTSVATLVILIYTTPTFYGETLLTQNYKKLGPLKYLIENNYGTISVDKNNAVYGNGIYDGNTEINLINDKSAIYRAVMLPYFKNDISNVLLIGLSCGSWAKVLADNPLIKKLTVIEINPGYVSLIKHLSKQKGILKNKKVAIILSDGRRWLKRHPSRKFDAIIMNTTFFFTHYASLLLSEQMLKLVKKHLNQNGIFYYNTTGSKRAIATALTQFKYVNSIYNFLAASNTPFAYDFNNITKLFTRDSTDDSLYHRYSEKNRATIINRLRDVASSLKLNLQSIQNYGMMSRKSLQHFTHGAKVITNDNMGSEWINYKKRF